LDIVRHHSKVEQACHGRSLAAKGVVHLLGRSSGEKLLAPRVLLKVLGPSLGDRSGNGDAADPDFGGDDGSEGSSHAVAEDENLFGIDVRQLLRFGQGLTIDIHLGVEVDGLVGPSFAVADTRLVHADGDPPVYGKRVENLAVGAGTGERRVHYGRSESLDHDDRRKSPGAFRLGVDGAHPLAVACHVAVDKVVLIRFLARTLYQRAGQLDPLAISEYFECDRLARRVGADELSDRGISTHGRAVNGQEHIPILHSSQPGRLVGKDAGQKKALAFSESGLLSKVGGDGGKLGAERWLARQLLDGRKGKDGQEAKGRESHTEDTRRRMKNVPDFQSKAVRWTARPQIGNEVNCALAPGDLAAIGPAASSRALEKNHGLSATAL
jgi:hypothetical protein